MKAFKTHKREARPKVKDQIGETMHRAKPTNNKVKYNHKNYWLEEEMAEVVPYRMKKKKRTA